MNEMPHSTQWTTREECMPHKRQIAASDGWSWLTDSSLAVSKPCMKVIITCCTWQRICVNKCSYGHVGMISWQRPITITHIVRKGKTMKEMPHSTQWSTRKECMPHQRQIAASDGWSWLTDSSLAVSKPCMKVIITCCTWQRHCVNYWSYGHF